MSNISESSPVIGLKSYWPVGLGDESWGTRIAYGAAWESGASALSCVTSASVTWPCVATGARSSKLRRDCD
jgi:hypothetical protein